MKRKRQPTDKRLDWRDKNMPVLMRVSYDGGKTFQLGEIEPQAVQEYYRQKMLKLSIDPEWRWDETYDMKRKK